jgi:phenol 2-monooxygenase
VWGVIDIWADTDFPGVRHKAYLNSKHGPVVIIPRERDLIRLYVGLLEGGLLDAQGRVELSKVNPQVLMKVCHLSHEDMHRLIVKVAERTEGVWPVSHGDDRRA